MRPGAKADSIVEEWQRSLDAVSMRQLVALTLLALMLCGPAAAQETERPNFLFLITDDQRNDSLGCAGNPVLQTPVIDGLASSGVRFVNAFVTTPICAASRASFLTGAWERRHGYTFGTPPLTAELIADSYPAVLRKAGYRSGFVGKYGVRAQRDSTDVMFDFFRSYGQPFQKKQADGSTRHLTDIAGDDALEFLRSCDGSQPFCLTVSFNAPHAEDQTKENPYPFSPPEAELYLDSELPQPLVATEFWKSLPEFFSRSLHRERWFWRWDTPEKYDRFLRDYYRMISGIDRVTGLILAELEARGLAENTVVIFTSDNGYYMGSRGFAGKWSHYEESLRVPLVIHDPRNPEVEGGRLASELALNVDLAPTILELAGVELPASYQGSSLAPILTGDSRESWRDDFLFEHLFDNPKLPRMVGVRGERHVYARYIDHLPEGEFLHDLQQDPQQLINLAFEPEHADLLARMRARCDELRSKTGNAPTLSKGLFRTPPRSARPMVLWPWLNGYVDREQVTRELEEMRAKGLRGPIIWDVGSLADPEESIPIGPEFLGEQSLRSIHHAADEAERLGLDLGLVASSSWNAGGSWIDAEHASKHLRWTELDVEGPASLSEVLPAPDELATPFVDVAVVALSAGPGADPIDLTTKMDAAGRLTWEVPAGSWRVLRFVRACTGQSLVCPSPASNGLIVDHMSAEATDHHFGVILDRLFPDGKGKKALTHLMLDSFEVWPSTDWTPGFISEFRETYDYDPVPLLPVLAGHGSFEASFAERFLQDYRALVSRLMIRNHFGRAAKIAEEHGLALLSEAGHGGYPRVDPLQALGVAQVPMGEFWNGKQHWVTKEAASAAHIYGRRDVAAEALTGWRSWQDGPQEYRRLCDLAFCAGLTRPVFHTFAHNPPEAGKPGFAYHAGEHFNVNSTWWNQAGPFVEYLSRCAHLLRQGHFVADVCFYYGDQAPNLVPSRRIDPKATSPHDEGECPHCGRALPNRIESLGKGYDFDYVNRDIIERDMQVRDGRLVLSSGMEYRVLVLPDRDDIALPVLRKLEVLVREGATLVGRPPQRANSLEGYPECDEEVRRLARLLWGDGSATGAHLHGKGQVFPEVALDEVLRGMGVEADFTVMTPDQHAIDFIHRRTEREEIFFVVNTADAAVDALCSFRVAQDMRPFLWNAEDGSVRACSVYQVGPDSIQVPLSLPPVSSIFVVFQRSDPLDPITAIRRSDQSSSVPLLSELEVMGRTAKGVRVRARRGGRFEFTTAGGRSGEAAIEDPPVDLILAGPWTIEFPGEGNDQVAPSVIEITELVSWPQLQNERARFFSGTARYKTTLEVPPDYLGPGIVVHLDLGEVADVAEISLNGKSLGILWNAPYRLNVSPWLKEGANVLEVRLTNLWHNRIVGDLRAPAAGVHAHTNIKHKFRADMMLLPSGLLGPVVLRPEIEVEVPLQ